MGQRASLLGVQQPGPSPKGRLPPLRTAGRHGCKMPITATFGSQNSARLSSLRGRDDKDFFMKENQRLTEENEGLKAKMLEQFNEMERLQTAVAKLEVASEVQKVQDLQSGKHKLKEKEKKAKAQERYNTVPVITDDGKKEKERLEMERAASAGPIDTRKILDDFKKPLDDTRALLSEFAVKRQVPLLLEASQAQAMLMHSYRLTSQLEWKKKRIAELEARHDNPSKMSRAQRAKFDEALAELAGEKRRLADELSTLTDEFVTKRDDVRLPCAPPLSARALCSCPLMPAAHAVVLPAARSATQTAGPGIPLGGLQVGAYPKPDWHWRSSGTAGAFEDVCGASHGDGGIQQGVRRPAQAARRV